VRSRPARRLFVPVTDPRVWLAVLCAAALAYRLFYLLRPFDWVAAFFTADDFYYYTGTAWNVAHGHGSSCDAGLTHHNGYHPLFMWLMVPAFWLGAGKQLGAWWGLFLLAVANVASVWLVWRVAARTGNRWLALVPAVSLAINAYFVRSSLSGFEFALALCLLLALADAAQRGAGGLQLGLWLGLASLARVECSVAALPLALHLAMRGRWRDIAVAAATSLAVVSPWVIWSWVGFGSPFPLSGVAKAHSRGPTDLIKAADVFIMQMPRWFAGMWWPEIVGVRVAFTVGVALLVGAATQWRRHGLLLIFIVAHFLLYAMIGDPRSTFDFTRYLTFAGIAVIIAAAARQVQGWQTRLAWLAPVVLVLLVARSDREHFRYSLRAPVLDNYVGVCERLAPGILAEIAGPDDVVGCFDSGAMSYFSDVPVINLDGLVNAEIVDLLGSPSGGTYDQRYRRYLAEKKITIIAGGSGFSWVNIFPDLDTWPVLHDPVVTDSGERVVFLRVPSGGAAAPGS
jgi:hypothetical protein